MKTTSLQNRTPGCSSTVFVWFLYRRQLFWGISWSSFLFSVSKLYTRQLTFLSSVWRLPICWLRCLLCRMQCKCTSSLPPPCSYLYTYEYFRYVYVQGGYWFLGPLMCDIYSASDVACSTASILLLAVISFDRCSPSSGK